MNDRIAVIGASGLLGSALVKEIEKAGIACVRGDFSKADLKNYALVDITNIDSLDFFIDTWKPNIIINCAAYTKVDDAETEYDACFLTNSIGPEILSKICRVRDIYLVHISTDYVFGGSRHESRGRNAFSENESCSPCGIYGWSKYFGEQAVINLLPSNSVIVRTSWLHGATGPNFIKSICKVAREKKQLKVVNDQFGSMTWAPWLAQQLIELTKQRITGIVHACASDVTSWYDIAEQVLKKNHIDCELLPQTTAESGRKAPRPAYSKLSTTALAAITSMPVPTNNDFIDRYLDEVKC